jgi:hypothetical protein
METKTNLKKVFIGAVVTFFLGFQGTAFSQDLVFLRGLIQDTKSGSSSDAWQIEYQKHIGDYYALSVAYLNDGHLSGHRTDGLTAQFWLGKSFLNDHVALAAGLGPYLWADTIDGRSGSGYENRHGISAIATLTASYYADNGLIFQLRSNYVEVDARTISVLAGIGYQLDKKSPVNFSDAVDRNEISAMLGMVIVNSSDSQRLFAQKLEYRHIFSRHVDMSAAILNEGSNELIDRQGLTVQIWLVDTILNDKLRIGLGAGPYFEQNKSHGQNKQSIDGMVSILADYQISHNWLIRATWDRALTNYDRDTDMIFVGPGYRF